MKFELVQQQCCPRCNALLDGLANTTSDRSPDPGDYTVCVYCAAILRFDDAMRLRQVLASDLEELDTDAFLHMLRVRAAIVAVQQMDEIEQPEQ